MNKVFIVTETVIMDNEYMRFQIVDVYDTFEEAEERAINLTIQARRINDNRTQYTYDVEQHELKCAKYFENN